MDCKCIAVFLVLVSLPPSFHLWEIHLDGLTGMLNQKETLEITTDVPKSGFASKLSKVFWFFFFFKKKG